MMGTTSFTGGRAPGRSVCFVFLAFAGPRVRLGGIVVRIDRKVVVKISRLRGVDVFDRKLSFNHDFFWIT